VLELNFLNQFYGQLLRGFSV